MEQHIIQVLMAGIGTLGFALFFSVNKKHVAAATIGGTLAWAIYLIVYNLTKSLFIGNMIAAMVVCIWSELMARTLKAPANIFMIPGIIPLLPGGALYYTMDAMIQRNRNLFMRKGIETAIITVGIVAGIVAASIIFLYIVTATCKRMEKDSGTYKQD